MEKNFENKRKMLSVLLILVAVVVIVIMAVYFLGNVVNKENEQVGSEDTVNFVETSEGSKLNTSSKVAEDKKVGNVLIEKSQIIFENGVSKLTSKVTNDAVAKENLRFKVKFIANDGSTISESVGYIGPIKANETRYINSDITLDVTNAKEIIYEIM